MTKPYQTKLSLLRPYFRCFWPTFWPNLIFFQFSQVLPPNPTTTLVWGIQEHLSHELKLFFCLVMLQDQCAPPKHTKVCWNSCFVWVPEHVLNRLFTSFKVRVTLDTEPWPSSWEQREERVEARAKSDNCRDAARTIPNVQGWQSAGLSDSEDLGDIVMKKSRYRWFISEVGNKMSCQCKMHRFYIYISEDYDVKWLLVNSLELCQWHYPIWCLRVEINDTKECCKTPRLAG